MVHLFYLNHGYMWQEQKKDNVIINLALLMSITASSTVANLLISAPVHSKSQNHSPAFYLANVTPSATPTTTSTVSPTATSTVNQNPSLSTIPEIRVTQQPLRIGGEIQLVNPFSQPSMITKNLGFFLLLPLFLIAGLTSCLPLWWRRKKQSLNSKTDSISASDISDSETIPETCLFGEAAEETLGEIATPTTTNNHNGFNDNHFQEEISPEVTPASNLAVIDLPQTISSINQAKEIKEINQLDSDYSSIMWDTEAPVIVVNNHYPQIPNIHHNLIDADIPTDEFTNSLLEAPESPTPISESESESDPKIISLSELLDTPPKPFKKDNNISLSELLGISPTPIKQLPQDQNLLSDLPLNLEEALNSITNDIQLNTSEIVEEILATSFHPTTTDEDIAMGLDAEIEAWTTINQINASENTRIVFTPRTPKWAYVSWYISDSDKLKQAINHQQILQNQRFITLAVRLYDVTHLDLSYQLPELVQQYECETAIHDCYIPIPKGERDYMTEIGYLINNYQWICLARSATVHVFGTPSTDFWFVVDTELVIYGATKQDAIVTIDGQNIKLNADGTFKVSVPFVDNLVDYQMIATSVDEEDTKTIYQKFFQEKKEN
ncbi:DUF4912 domain-containing protein [Dolichospermum sp. FACHB-1091]|uniref:DUF4912 domain-containing protein n=1 Tax=Dolichospermum sp. FACHB-1091 TaxID=2692798 RepID=UPI00168036FD|nr:DUF4912 domain-containing protein [Dolichospermum sp. FACHB-1091]MBD2443336.1 DUF4912 domain-containing protein [Dolichospermum sp. FACHB-1091]